jgi:hypothetical protein
LDCPTGLARVCSDDHFDYQRKRRWPELALFHPEVKKPPRAAKGGGGGTEPAPEPTEPKPLVPQTVE